MPKDGEVLQAYIEINDLSKTAVAKDLDRSRQQLYQLFDTNQFTEETIKRVENYFQKSFKELKTYYNVNIDKWENIKNKNEIGKGEITKAPQGRFPKKTKAGELIKFYDTDFAAGNIEFYDDHSSITPAYTMDVPEFAGCTAFRTYGDSMENLIKSGSILFGTKIEDWRSHLEYGQIYGIICTDKRRYLKYIRNFRRYS